MMTADTRTKLDSILATGILQVERRVLTCDLDWPTDLSGAIIEPPFPAGEMVSLPAVPASPPVYAAATFDPAVWTDCSAFVTRYACQWDAATQIGQARLQVPMGWAESMDSVWREMRAVLIQERYSGHDGAGTALQTAWETRLLCISDGYTETWDPARGHFYEVQARDVLKLAHLERLGAATGQATYQGDVITEGTFASHIQLTYSRDAGDAYEYFLPSRGGYQQPNWADKPPPILWCHNADGATEPVKLTVAGDALQVVFGEGIVRIQKTFAHASPGADYDYTLGLGIAAGSQPDIRGVISRFAHPEVAGFDAESDVVDDLEVTGAGAGYILVTGDYSAYPDGLTLILLDGTGTRYATTGISYSAPTSRIDLADTGVTIAVGTHCRYGDCNRARDVIRRWLLDSGFQADDSGEPFYLTDPEAQTIGGVSYDLILPPLPYEDTDGLTPVDAMEDLRRRGHLPPNYLARATPAGAVVTGSIAQLADGHPDILSLGVLLPPAQVQRTGGPVVTRVVARGLVRQVQDLMGTSASLSWVAEADGGLTGTPAITAHVDWSQTLTRLYGEIPPLRALTLDWRMLRGWSTHPVSRAEADQVAAQWGGAYLCEIDLGAEETVERLTLDVSNPFVAVMDSGSGWDIIPHGDKLAADGVSLADSRVGWGDTSRGYVYGLPNRTMGSKFNPGLEMQSIAVDYLDPLDGAWKPLVSYIPSRRDFPDVITVEASGFDNRQRVTTQYLRVRCVEPTVFQSGTYDESWWYCAVCVFLSRLRVWSSAEVRGEAALGETAPFGTAAWVANRVRLRTRTHVLPDAVPWVTTEAEAEALALEWLKDFARDYAAREVKCVRPDVSQWDTVQVTLPDGVAENYLVVGVLHESDGKSTLALVNYEVAR